MSEAIASGAVLNVSAAEPRNAVGRACLTCSFRIRSQTLEIYDKCGMFMTYCSGEREASEDGSCGPNGRFWKPKPPRLGLIPWLHRLLWGDAPTDPASPLSRGEPTTEPETTV